MSACKDNGFTLIYELAQRLNAAVAGSRAAYEKGYIIKEGLNPRIDYLKIIDKKGVVL